MKKPPSSVKTQRFYLENMLYQYITILILSEKSILFTTETRGFLNLQNKIKDF